MLDFNQERLSGSWIFRQHSAKNLTVFFILNLGYNSKYSNVKQSSAY